MPQSPQLAKQHLEWATVADAVTRWRSHAEFRRVLSADVGQPPLEFRPGAMKLRHRIHVADRRVLLPPTRMYSSRKIARADPLLYDLQANSAEAGIYCGGPEIVSGITGGAAHDYQKCSPRHCQSQPNASGDQLG
jgi:hypothetical protein